MDEHWCAIFFFFKVELHSLAMEMDFGPTEWVGVVGGLGRVCPTLMDLASQAEQAHLDTDSLRLMKAHMHAQMNTSHSLMDVHSNCVDVSLPAVDCSRLAPGLCP